MNVYAFYTWRVKAKRPDTSLSHNTVLLCRFNLDALQSHYNVAQLTTNQESRYLTIVSSSKTYSRKTREKIFYHVTSEQLINLRTIAQCLKDHFHFIRNSHAIFVRMQTFAKNQTSLLVKIAMRTLACDLRIANKKEIGLNL